MKKVVGILAVVMFIVSVISIGSAKAFDQITAQEAYNMLDPSNVPPSQEEPCPAEPCYDPDTRLIDVRTTAEYLWVGTCKLPDGTTPHNIPWKIWAGEIAEVDTSGKYEAGGIVVERLFRRLITRTFPEGSTLILMCRSGKRTSDAAEYLETKLQCKNYTVYEIDNSDKDGRGGFQGSSSNCPTDRCCTSGIDSSGYRGYPGRFPCGSADDEEISVETVTSQIDTEEDSVSWMDTGLPMTQKVDKDKIWKYMWKPCCKHKCKPCCKH